MPVARTIINGGTTKRTTGHCWL